MDTLCPMPALVPAGITLPSRLRIEKKKVSKRTQYRKHRYRPPSPRTWLYNTRLYRRSAREGDQQTTERKKRKREKGKKEKKEKIQTTHTDHRRRARGCTARGYTGVLTNRGGQQTTAPIKEEGEETKKNIQRQRPSPRTWLYNTHRRRARGCRTRDTTCVLLERAASKQHNGA